MCLSQNIKDPLQSPIRFTAGASFPQGKPSLALPWGRVGVAGVRINSVRAGLLQSTPALKARVDGPRARFNFRSPSFFMTQRNGDFLSGAVLGQGPAQT